MTDDYGMGDSRELETGETADLFKTPNGKWRIRQYELSWAEHVDSGEGKISKVSGDAAKLGWGDLEFDTPDDAYAFLEDQIRKNPALQIKPPSPTQS
ncbi:MAG: hypothetical protein H0T47_04535 [Planctomycetaceae bacterium]|nr:hypothetical protein [Planctomycetaceae bacterium]